MCVCVCEKREREREREGERERRMTEHEEQYGGGGMEHTNENENGVEYIAKRLSFGDVTATLRSTELPAGVGDVFRAASCTDPNAETLQRALSELTNANERFERVMSVASEQAEGNGEGDAARLRQHFQSLKTNYTQLQTKDEFLRLITGPEEAMPTEETCARLEASVAESKTDMKRTKEANVEREEQLKALIADVTSTYENYLAETAFLSKKVGEVREAEAMANETAERDEQHVDTEGLDANECERLVAEAAEKEQAIASEAQKREEEEKRLVGDIAMANMRIESLQSELAELRKTDGGRSAKDAEDARSRADERWSDGMVSFIEKLSRVRVVETDEDAVHIVIGAGANHEYTCRILLHRASGSIRDIELSPSDIHGLQAVVDAVKDTRHVEAAVQEVRGLIVDKHGG